MRELPSAAGRRPPAGRGARLGAPGQRRPPGSGGPRALWCRGGTRLLLAAFRGGKRSPTALGWHEEPADPPSPLLEPGAGKSPCGGRATLAPRSAPPAPSAPLLSRSRPWRFPRSFPPSPRGGLRGSRSRCERPRLGKLSPGGRYATCPAVTAERRASPTSQQGFGAPQPRRHPGRWRCRGDPAPPAAPQGPGRLRPGRAGLRGASGGGWGLFPVVGACSWLLGLVPGGCGLFTVFFCYFGCP